MPVQHGVCRVQLRLGEVVDESAQLVGGTSAESREEPLLVDQRSVCQVPDVSGVMTVATHACARGDLQTRRAVRAYHQLGPKGAEMARPTRLTPRRMACLQDAIKLGSYISTACEHAGISESTYYRWRERGETSLLTHDENVAGDHTDAHPVGLHPDADDYPQDPCPACGAEWAFIEFSEADSRARSEAVMEALTSINRAATPQVRRERRHRDGSVTLVEYESDWRAAAWLLERRYPDQWRRRRTDEPTDEELEARLKEALDAFDEGQDHDDRS